MRVTKFTSLLAIGAVFFIILLGSNGQLHQIIKKYVENGEIVTLESRYTPEQIMRLHQETLLPSSKYTFQEPSLKFNPYLLMEVKYAQQNGKTKEGIILWSMVNGEMVIDADTWELTSGFSDTIRADASRSDMIILQHLSSQKDGKMALSQLQKAMNVEPRALEKIIKQASDKYLVTQKGNTISLHFENPHFNVVPLTRINQRLVTKPYHHAKREDVKYSQNQIEKMAKAAFGKDFTIRSSQEVYLPVYNIDVLNPDGSHLISQWNALTGRQVNGANFLSY